MADIVRIRAQERQLRMGLRKSPISDPVESLGLKEDQSDAVFSSVINSLLELKTHAREIGLEKLNALVDPLVLEVSNIRNQRRFERENLPSNESKAKNCYSLSEREIQCLKWCAEGKTYWETGKILGISERTVVFHTKSAKEKMDCVSLAQCVVKVVRANII